MAKQKETRQALTNNEVRSVVLRYFYDRNRNATSSRGKKGSSVKIKRRETGIEGKPRIVPTGNPKQSHVSHQPGVGERGRD